MGNGEKDDGEWGMGIGKCEMGGVKYFDFSQRSKWKELRSNTRFLLPFDKLRVNSGMTEMGINVVTLKPAAYIPYG